MSREAAVRGAGAGPGAPPRKVVILARGLGTRMRRLDPVPGLDPRQVSAADSGMKAMIPFGRPFMDYLLRSLADAGLEEACLVVGPEHSAIREYYTVTAPPRRIGIAFAIQEEPRGTADALLSAVPFVGEDSFLTVNSDNLYPPSALSGLRSLRGPGVVLFPRDAPTRGSNIPPERIAAFSVCRLAPDGTLASIIEKPGADPVAVPGEDFLISMNCWRFSPAIFRACREIPLSSRGELELPQAVQHAVSARAARFHVVLCREGVLDLSSRADIPAVAERLRHLPAEP